MKAWAIEQLYKAYADESSSWFQGLAPEQQHAQRLRARANAEGYVNRLLTAIETKDIACLNKSIHNGNKTSKAIFTRATGLKLGTTEKRNREILRQYVGPEDWDQWYAARDAERERVASKEKADRAERDKQRAIGELVRYCPDGGGLAQTITIRALIPILISNGYTTLEPTQRGAFTDWRLLKGNRFYQFRKKLVVEYIREQLSRIAEEAVA